MAGWVVGKSDFNENPVVSLDLDLDFGLGLRVCQFLMFRIQYVVVQQEIYTPFQDIIQL